MVSRVTKVLALFLIWCSMGLYMEIPGPTMIDIKLIFNATYNEVSRSVSGRGAGGLTGALIGGFLIDKYENSLDIFIAVSETLAGLAVMGIPFSPSVNTLWFHYFCLGALGAILGIAGIRSVIRSWEAEKTAMVLQLLHVGYGLGSLLVPVFVDQFLAIIVYQTDKTGNQDDKEMFTVIKDTRVHVAFVTIGVGSIVLSLIFYYFYFVDNKSLSYSQLPTDEKTNTVAKGEDESTVKSKSFTDMINPGTYANGNFGFGLFMFIALSIYYVHMVGVEEVYGQFVRSFSVDIFKFSKSEASYLNMTYWLGLTVGRLCWSGISSFFTINNLFAFQIFIHAIATTVINIFAPTSSSFLWMGTAVEGFLVSPLFPTGIAYSNTLIEVTGVCLMVIQVSGSLGDLSFIWISGKLYDSLGPRSFLYVVQYIGIALLGCVVLFRVGERWKQRIPLS